MDTSTRLPGHGLLSEGKPHVRRLTDEDDAPSWHRTDRWVSTGCGVCSCGAASLALESDGARKRWHKAHKEQVRETAAQAEKE